MKIGEWLDDSGVGYGECLNAIWRIGALRMVDICGDPGDKDLEVCLRRGYDGKGRPLCAHGYPMRSNGYDHERRRAKYVCAQVCRREPLHEKEVQLADFLLNLHTLGRLVREATALDNN